MKRLQRPESDLGYELDVSAELGEESVTDVDVNHEAGITVTDPQVVGGVLRFDVTTTAQVGPHRISMAIITPTHRIPAELVIWVVNH
jgi:hypothetical protein